MKTTVDQILKEILSIEIKNYDYYTVVIKESKTDIELMDESYKNPFDFCERNYIVKLDFVKSQYRYINNTDHTKEYLLSSYEEVVDFIKNIISIREYEKPLVNIKLTKDLYFRYLYNKEYTKLNISNMDKYRNTLIVLEEFYKASNDIKLTGILNNENTDENIEIFDKLIDMTDDIIKNKKANMKYSNVLDFNGIGNDYINSLMTGMHYRIIEWMQYNLNKKETLIYCLDKLANIYPIFAHTIIEYIKYKDAPCYHINFTDILINTYKKNISKYLTLYGLDWMEKDGYPYTQKQINEIAKIIISKKLFTNKAYNSFLELFRDDIDESIINKINTKDFIKKLGLDKYNYMMGRVSQSERVSSILDVFEKIPNITSTFGVFIIPFTGMGSLSEEEFSDSVNIFASSIVSRINSMESMEFLSNYHILLNDDRREMLLDNITEEIIKLSKISAKSKLNIILDYEIKKVDTSIYSNVEYKDSLMRAIFNNLKDKLMNEDLEDGNIEYLRNILIDKLL